MGADAGSIMAILTGVLAFGFHAGEFLIQQRRLANRDWTANRLTMVDIAILAAAWDGRITPNERAALEDALRKALKKVHVPVNVDQTVARWMSHLTEATAEQRAHNLEMLAGELTSEEREETFAIVAAILLSDHREAAGGPASPFRHAEPESERVLRSFAKVLKIADDEVQWQLEAARPV